MISSQDFIEGLASSGIQFVTGVPDSLLKDVCACISNSLSSQQHIIATNEGSAIAMAIGHYLATSHPALVYMQNSGLGNAVNPLASLADPEVYGIPMVLMIGWRGELLSDKSQLKDEPQHVKQGRITLDELDVLGIPYIVIDQNTKSISDELQKTVDAAHLRSGPVALVVRKNTFSKESLNLATQNHIYLEREVAIKQVLELLPEEAIIVSTTGKASRELFELRKKMQAGHYRDFLTVGGMGHASQIAVGIAIAKPERIVVCLDGDGAVLMHAGSLAISADCPNLIHVVLNNEAHDSVGGQPTKGSVLQFDQIAKVFGYDCVKQASTVDELRDNLTQLLNRNGSRLLEIRCKRGSRADLGRPDRSPAQNKIDFMNFLGAHNER